MPGKNCAEAINAYITPLQQSVSCFSRAVLRSSKYEVGPLLNLIVSEPIEVCTQAGEILILDFQQSFHVEKTPFFRNFKVCTREYIYSISDHNEKEILAFHWHPETTADNPVVFPHLHILDGAGKSIRPEVRNIHFRTDRVAFEDVALLLINEFGVVPDRSDAKAVLNENLTKFVTYRTWHSK